MSNKPSLPPTVISRPDPITIDQIASNLGCCFSNNNSGDNVINSNSINPQLASFSLIALNTVVHHPLVKRIIMGDVNEGDINKETNDKKNTNDNKSVKSFDYSKNRYLPLLKTLATNFSDIINNNKSFIDIYTKESMWDTLAIIGELCRVETENNNDIDNDDKNNNNKDIIEAKNEDDDDVARYFYQYFSSLDFFRLALEKLSSSMIDLDNDSINNVNNNRNRRKQLKEDKSSNNYDFIDEDVRIIANDLHSAFSLSPLKIPESVDKTKIEDKKKREEIIVKGNFNDDNNNNDNNNKSTTNSDNYNPQGLWNKEIREKCKDLMFLDASNRSKHHHIPFVSRFISYSCSFCKKTLPPISSSVENKNTSNQKQQKPEQRFSSTSLSRCSQCKAVFYCSQQCQVNHWKSSHKADCEAYKALLLAEKNSENTDNNSGNSSLPHSEKGKKKTSNKGNSKDNGNYKKIPLLNSLFYETRHYLYEKRPPSFKDCNFDSYFMDYYTPVML